MVDILLGRHSRLRISTALGIDHTLSDLAVFENSRYSVSHG
jgi:hypothetical protein